MTPLEEVKAHPLFDQLTPLQQTFVTHYVETQDLVMSARLAGYNCRDDKRFELMARKNLKNASIKKLVSIGLKYDPIGGLITKPEALMLLSDQIHKAENSTMFYRLMSLYADLKKWTSPKPDLDINRIVQASEEKRRQERNKG
jgi:hypothetical protein